MSLRGIAVAASCAALCGIAAFAADEVPAEKIPADQFRQLHTLIKPQPGESKWATIPWLTSLPQARTRAVDEDKPLFVWRAGGGEVFGRA